MRAPEDRMRVEGITRRRRAVREVILAEGTRLDAVGLASGRTQLARDCRELTRDKGESSSNGG